MIKTAGTTSHMDSAALQTSNKPLATEIIKLILFLANTQASKNSVTRTRSVAHSRLSKQMDEMNESKENEPINTALS